MSIDHLTTPNSQTESNRILLPFAATPKRLEYAYARRGNEQHVGDRYSTVIPKWPV
jgi:hypothetical protein